VRWIVGLAMLSGCDYVWRLDHLADAGTGTGMPQLTLALGTTGTTETSLALALQPPDGENRLLLVAVAMSADAMHLTPTVGTITYGGVALTARDVINTVPDSPGTRTELWQLVAPPTGTNSVAATLVSPAIAVHVDAYTFINVNQTMPVRATVHGSGRATSASLAVPCADGDLVVSVVGQGTTIDSVASPQAAVLLENVESGHTLNNTAGSVGPGANQATTVAWTFQPPNDDNWQLIVAALQP
jgi:hypothetical protein